MAVSTGLLIFDILTRSASLQQLGLALGYVLIASLIDITHVRREWSRVEEFILTAKVALSALIVTAIAAFLLSIPISRIVFLAITLSMLVIRPLIAFAVLRIHWLDDDIRTVVLICDEAEYAQTMDAVASQEVRAIRVVDHLQHKTAIPPTDCERSFPAGGAGDLLRICGALWPWRVAFGTRYLRDPLFLETLSEINEMGIQVRSIPRLFEEEFGRVPLASLDTSWFLFDMRSLHRLGYRVTRRGLDMAAGILSLMGFLLVMPLVAAAIKIDSRGPVFFRQTRTGQSGRLFSMTKFRTMKVDAEQSGPVFTCKGDGRVTRVGRILRSTRIDELPQSVNLLRGEMSLIGPRPERPEFVGVFSEEIPFYGKRQLIKPGLTGWAQVHEGYTDSLNGTVRKLERDLYYLKHQSVALDLRIVAATVSAVVKLGGR